MIRLEGAVNAPFLLVGLLVYVLVGCWWRLIHRQKVLTGYAVVQVCKLNLHVVNKRI